LDWGSFKIWIRFANVVDFKDVVVFFDYDVVERTQREEEKGGDGCWVVVVVVWFGEEAHVCLSKLPFHFFIFLIMNYTCGLFLFIFKF